MDKKIFFFDYDGTLRNQKDDSISDNTYEAIESLRKNGHLVFINTGRPKSAIDRLAKSIEVDGYICGCGTYIEHGDKVIFETELKPSLHKLVLDALEVNQVEFIIEGHSALYISRDIDHKGLKEFIIRMISSGVNIMHTDSPSLHFSKMVCAFKNPESKERFEKELEEHFDYIEQSDVHTEAVMKGYTKAKGMNYLAEKLGFSKEDIYAFGDGNNDLEMLEEAGVSVAIGQDAPLLLEYADYQAPPADQDGVYKILKEMKLI